MQFISLILPGTVSDFAALQQAYPKTIFHVENYKSSRRFLTRNLVLSSNTSSGVSSRGLESDSAEDDDELEQLQRIKIAKQHRNHDASDTAEHSFDLMVQSDIFIATESCFSSLIAGAFFVMIRVIFTFYLLFVSLHLDANRDSLVCIVGETHISPCKLYCVTCAFVSQFNGVWDHVYILVPRAINTLFHIFLLMPIPFLTW